MPVGGYVPVPSDPQFDDVDLTGINEDSIQVIQIFLLQFLEYW